MISFLTIIHPFTMDLCGNVDDTVNTSEVNESEKMTNEDINMNASSSSDEISSDNIPLTMDKSVHANIPHDLEMLNDDDNKDIENKCAESVEPIKNTVPLSKNWREVKNSFYINRWFWIVVTLCVFILSIDSDGSDVSFLAGFSTLIFAMIAGWVVHCISHHYDFYAMYESSGFSKVCSKVPFLDTIIRNIMYYVGDFHDKIHHDTSVNKTPINLLMEIAQNILTQGGIVILLSAWLDFGLLINGQTFALNHSVLLLWGLFYATIHNINYNFMTNKIHEEHHLNNRTNYGIDIVDIIFDTKYDLSHIEDHNHGIINIVMITGALIFLRKWAYNVERKGTWKSVFRYTSSIDDSLQLRPFKRIVQRLLRYIL
jgi:hypothetical protein